MKWNFGPRWTEERVCGCEAGHEQLEAWCAEHRYPLYMDETAQVWEEK